MNRSSVRTAAVLMALLASLGFSVDAINRWRIAASKEHDLRVTAPASKSENVGKNSPRGADLNQIAVATHLGRLTSVTLPPDGVPGDTRIEWESDFASSVAFLSALQRAGLASRVPELSVTSIEQEPGTVHGRATLRKGALSGPQITFTLIGRNVFKPLWKSEIRIAAVASENLRREEERRRQEQARTEKDRQIQDAANQRAALKRNMESRYAVTGIAEDGHGTLAFLSADRTRSLLVRSGDPLEDARVSVIDAKSGTVTLDANGAFTVVLRLGAGSPP